MMKLYYRLSSWVFKVHLMQVYFPERAFKLDLEVLSSESIVLCWWLIIVVKVLLNFLLRSTTG